MKERLVKILTNYGINSRKPKGNLRQAASIFKECLDEESRTEFLKICFDYTRLDVIKFLFHGQYLSKSELTEIAVSLQIIYLQVPSNLVLDTTLPHVKQKFSAPESLLKSILKNTKFSAEELIDIDTRALFYFRENRKELPKPDATKMDQAYRQVFLKYEALLNTDMNIKKRFKIILALNHLYLTTPLTEPESVPHLYHNVRWAVTYASDSYAKVKRKRILYSKLLDRLEENEPSYYSKNKLEDLYLQLLKSGSKGNLRRLHKYLGYHIGRVGVTSQNLKVLVENHRLWGFPSYFNADMGAQTLLSKGHFIYDFNFLITLAKEESEEAAENLKYWLRFIQMIKNHPNKRNVAFTLHDQNYTLEELSVLTFENFKTLVKATSNLELFRDCITSFIFSKKASLLKLLLNKCGYTEEFRSCRFDSFGSPALTRLITRNDPSQNDIDMIEALIEHGADVDEPDEWGIRALHHAAHEEGCEEYVPLLLRHGADVNAITGDGFTALYRSSLKVSEMLLANGANINAQTGEVYLNEWSLLHGVTPLIYAASRGNADKVSLLLKHGADASLTTEHGDTAFDIAVSKGDWAVVQVFLDHNVAPSPRALLLASNNGMLERLESDIKKKATTFQPQNIPEAATIIPAHVVSSSSVVRTRANSIER